MPEIPVPTARSHAPAGRSPRLNPRIAAAGGFGEAAGTAARLFEEEYDRRQQLNDFNARSQNAYEFNDFAGAALDERRNAKNPFDPDEYKKNLEAERDRRLGELENVSAEGRARIADDLNDQITRSHTAARALADAQRQTLAVDNLGALVNRLGRDLFENPAQIRAAMAELDAAAARLDGAIDANALRDARRAGRAKLATLAASAWASVGAGDKAEAVLKNPAWADDLDPKEREAAKDNIRAELRARDAELDRRQRIEERAKKAAADKAESALIDQSVADPLKIDPRMIARSDMSNEDKLKWIDRLPKIQSGAPIKTDPDLYVKLFRRIHSPDDAPGHIADVRELDVYFGAGLAMDDLKTLRTEITSRGTTEGKIEAELKKYLVIAAKSRLSGSNSLLGFKDPKGDEQVLRFMSWFLPEYQRQRAGGKTPNDLLNPESKDYLGKAINNFARPFEEMLRDLMPLGPRAEGGSGAAAAAKDYATVGDLVADVRAGKISKAKAEEISRKKGWSR